MNKIIIEDKKPKITVENNVTVVKVTRGINKVISVGLQGPTGPKGDTGAGVGTLSTESSVNIKAGQPVKIISDGRLDLASGNVINGFCTEDVLSSFAAVWVSSGILDLADWTESAGTVFLVKGSDYYLDQSVIGKITNIVPVTSGDFVLIVGKAISDTKLDINIHPSILLS